MKHVRWWAVVAVMLGGCIQNEYELELTPDGKTVQRTLSVKRHASKTNAEAERETNRLAEEYGIAPPAVQNQQTWQGHFEARMPKDIGGYGTYTRWETPLGSAFAYVERFRGDDDTAGVLHRREAAARRLVDLAIGWLEGELKDEPQWPTLHKFLDEEFRRDLINVSVYTWFQHLSGTKEEPATPAVSLLNYLVEHGYLTPEEIPAVRRAMDDAGREQYGRLLEWMRQLIVNRMGDETSPSPELAFLETRETLEASMRSYLESTQEYGVLFRAWQEQLQADPTTAKPDAFIVAGDLLQHIFAGVIQLGGDQLAITLHLDRPPIYTNGETSEDTADIRFPQRPLPHAEGSPLMAYAVWGDPNDAVQSRIFGKTILADRSLLDYCLWYQGLTPGERQEWDGLLESLPEAADRVEKLKSFRFRQEPASIQDDHRLAQPALNVILPAWNP